MKKTIKQVIKIIVGIILYVFTTMMRFAITPTLYAPFGYEEPKPTALQTFLSICGNIFVTVVLVIGIITYLVKDKSDKKTKILEVISMIVIALVIMSILSFFIQYIETYHKVNLPLK